MCSSCLYLLLHLLRCRASTLPYTSHHPQVFSYAVIILSFSFPHLSRPHLFLLHEPDARTLRPTTFVLNLLLLLLSFFAFILVDHCSNTLMPLEKRRRRPGRRPLSLFYPLVAKHSLRSDRQNGGNRTGYTRLKGRAVLNTMFGYIYIYSIRSTTALSPCAHASKSMCRATAHLFVALQSVSLCHPATNDLRCCTDQNAPLWIKISFHHVRVPTSRCKAVVAETVRSCCANGALLPLCIRARNREVPCF